MTKYVVATSVCERWRCILTPVSFQFKVTNLVRNVSAIHLGEFHDYHEPNPINIFYTTQLCSDPIQRRTLPGSSFELNFACVQHWRRTESSGSHSVSCKVPFLKRRDLVSLSSWFSPWFFGTYLKHIWMCGWYWWWAMIGEWVQHENPVPSHLLLSWLHMLAKHWPHSQLYC